MTPARFVMFGLIACLVLTPLLGFAGGDVTLQIWNKHPRHAAGHHHDGFRLAWKATVGATAPPVPTVALAPTGWLSATVPAAGRSGVSRPPFVPPRF